MWKQREREKRPLKKGKKLYILVHISQHFFSCFLNKGPLLIHFAVNLANYVAGPDSILATEAISGTERTEKMQREKWTCGERKSYSENMMILQSSPEIYLDVTQRGSLILQPNELD